MYKIIRMYQRGGQRTIERGLTLEQARQHCQNPETSSSTCTRSDRHRITRRNGPWFDAYDECSR